MKTSSNRSRADLGIQEWTCSPNYGHARPGSFVVLKLKVLASCSCFCVSYCYGEVGGESKEEATFDAVLAAKLWR